MMENKIVTVEIAGTPGDIERVLNQLYRLATLKQNEGRVIVRYEQTVYPEPLDDELQRGGGFDR